MEMPGAGWSGTGEVYRAAPCR